MNAPSRTRLHTDLATLPAWLTPLIESLTGDGFADFTRWGTPPGDQARESAVLILFGHGADGPDVLLIERAERMRSHAGQPAFPGGARDAEDATMIDTALREAREETRLDPAGVAVVAELPGLWLPPSGFVVAPVIGWWRDPSPVSVGDPGEVAAVHRVPVAALAEPANRVRVTHPLGFVGPGFEVSGMLVWGFTAIILDRLLALAGWELPWDADARTVPFDDGYRGEPPPESRQGGDPR